MPPLFGLEVGEELRKRRNREICDQEMDEKGMFVYDLDWKCSQNWKNARKSKKKKKVFL